MASSAFNRSPELLSAAASRLLIVDMQEKFMPTLSDRDSLVEGCIKLLKAAALLGVPSHTTEQYPQGLGRTIPQLQEFFTEFPEKLRFSCVEALGWTEETFQPESRHQVVVAGIETHVCVLQTAFDLMTAGADVFVVVDATRSRQIVDHQYALRRLSDSGVRLVTTEMVLFEWCEVAGSSHFKEISKLVTGRS